MKYIKDNPKKSKWQVRAYNSTDLHHYGAIVGEITLSGREEYNYGLKIPVPVLWVRPNFIFSATMILKSVYSYYSTSHAHYEDIDDAGMKYTFVGDAFNEILKLVEKGAIRSEPRHIITGNFTFRKTSASLSCEAYTDPI